MSPVQMQIPAWRFVKTPPAALMSPILNLYLDWHLQVSDVCENPAGCSNVAYPKLILGLAPTGE